MCIFKTYLGCHTSEVQKGLIIGFILFIVSEVFAFLSVFWAFFHSSLSPSVEIGGVWPPQGIEPLNPYGLALMNTMFLLSSGASITKSHGAQLAGNRKAVIIGLFLTILLSFLFTFLQYFEYSTAGFTIADSVYGSAFFCSTGLHGLHVLVGTFFLLICFFRILDYRLTLTHHQGFESAILYWHFVDIVWLFLFISVYYWGGI